MWIFCVECGKNFEAIKQDDIACSETCLTTYASRKVSPPAPVDLHYIDCSTCGRSMRVAMTTTIADCARCEDGGA
jgi:DNA-directed RNA polymerase subunit RPC12/RpoP